MAIQLKKPTDELQDLYEKSSRFFVELLNQIAIAEFTHNESRKELLTRQLADLISGTQGIADIIGRRRIMLELDKLMQQAPIQFVEPTEETPIVPRLPFVEAIDDIITRQPRLVESRAEILRIYTVERGFALSRSASLNITERVQKAIADSLRRGEPITRTTELIQEIGNFSRAYAQTVFRTNVATAYSAGRFRQVQRPEVAEVIPAFQFVAVLDAATRPNHAAAHGLIASVNDEVWNRLSPPLGFNCRCALHLMDIFTLQRRGLLRPNGTLAPATIPAGAFADVGFGVRRADRQIYGF